MAQAGQCGRVGQAGRPATRTGAPPKKKQRCSTSCQAVDRRPAGTGRGRCQPHIDSDKASQPTTGCVRLRRSGAAAARPGTGRGRRARAQRGSPRSSGTIGAPSRMSGGATAMSRRCCTMCARQEEAREGVERRSGRDPERRPGRRGKQPSRHAGSMRAPQRAAAGASRARRARPTRTSAASGHGLEATRTAAPLRSDGGVRGRLSATTRSRAKPRRPRAAPARRSRGRRDCSGGCSVSRNATSAVTSAGLRFLP